MSKVPGGAKVVVSAAFAPSSLAVLAGVGLLALLLTWKAGVFLGFLALALGGAGYGARVLALAGDEDFARKALAAADMSRSALAPRERLALMTGFGKLSPAWRERVELLVDMSAKLDETFQSEVGKPLAEASPACAAQLDEAVELTVRGAGMEDRGKDTAELQGQVDRIVELLGEIHGELGTMGGGLELIEAATPRLEDLSGELEALSEGVRKIEA